MIRRSDVTVSDTLNTPLAGVYITVKNTAGAVATIYSDNGVTLKANPFQSGLGGAFEYWAADGTYTEEYRLTLAGQPSQVVAVELTEDLTLRTDLAASGGSAMVGFMQSGTGAVARTAHAKMREQFTSSDFPTLDAAIQAWAAAGGMLIVNSDYTITTAITTTLTGGKAYTLRSDGRRTITYNGASGQFAVKILGANLAPLEIDGDIVFDGGSLAARPLSIDYQSVSGTNRADLRVCGITGKNGKMNSAILDAAGIHIVGGFDHVLVERCKVQSITRAAGVGTPGAQGSTGIQIFGSLSTTANVKHVMVRDCMVDTVTSLDTPGTAAFTDMDGLLIFQGDEAGASAPVIERCKFNECLGRAIKVYTELGGAVARDIDITQTLQGRYEGLIGVAFQAGDGIMDGITLRLSSLANDAPTKTIPVSFANSASRTGTTYPMKPIIIRNVTIADSTGVSKMCVVDIYDNTATTANSQVIVSGVRDSGTAQQLVRIGQLGSPNNLDMILEGIDCSLTQAAFVTDDTMALVRIKSKFVRNRGAAVPAALTLALAAKALTWSQWRSDYTTVNIAVPGTGTATYDPPSLADGAGVTTTVTVAGAALGDVAVASFSLDLQGILLTAYVSAANTVTVRFQNETTGVIDLASGTITARLL